MRARSILFLAILSCGPGALAQGRKPASKSLAVLIANTSANVLRAVYIAPTGAASWGKNLLEADAIKPGGIADVRVAGGCGTYDVRLVADDGIEYLDDDVRLCLDEDLLIAGENDLTKASARNYSRAPQK